MKTAGNIIGIIAIIIVLFTYIPTNRKKLLYLKAISDLLWTFNMAFLGLYTGAILSFLCVIRGIIFSFKEDYKWAKSKLWLFLFLILTLISPIISYQGPISFLPMAGSLACVLGYFNNKTLVMKLCALFGAITWLIYAIITKNVTSIINNCGILLSLTLGFINELREKRKAL